MQTDINDIINTIPHKTPYRFVDEIIEVSESHIVGNFLLRPDFDFYAGHFPGSNLTPGFIVTEIMAQIGILGLGIYLNRDRIHEIKGAFLASCEIKFKHPSYAGDLLTVESTKIYFRFNKLKCAIKAFNQKGDLVCSGVFSGIIQ